VAERRLDRVSPNRNRCRGDALYRGFCRWKLLRKPDRNLIGFCGVGIWGDGLDPEIGWWLAHPCWGHGLATEAENDGVRLVRYAINRPQ